MALRIASLHFSETSYLEALVVDGAIFALSTSPASSISAERLVRGLTGAFFGLHPSRTSLFIITLRFVLEIEEEM